MKAIVNNGHYMFEEDSMDFDFPVELHIARFANNQFVSNPNEDYQIPFQNPDALKVYLNATEPVTSPNRELIESVIRSGNQYDLILTTDEEILEKCSNSVMFPYGTTWLNKGKIEHPDGFGEYDESLDELHENKRFEISFLCSKHQRQLEGYDKRKEIWGKASLFKNPTLFYSSTRHPISPYMLPEDDKKYLFESQFHIAIESSSVQNYFTEKLIDALITKTVPIYWGCPNIGDFFDARGMIIVDSETDIVEVCNNITPETYEDMKPFIDENFRRAKFFARTFSDRVKEEINREHQYNLERDNKKLLTIGICSLEEREESLNTLLANLQEITPPELKDSLQIIVNRDTGEKSVGQKRNEILESAEGKFVCFVDDDDKVDKDYTKWILSAISRMPRLDSIGFSGMYYHNGIPSMEFRHANEYGGHYRDKNNIQYRPINHLNPVRTTLARQIGFPEKDFGEDSDYCDRLFLSGKIRNEIIIPKIMYHYYYEDDKSRTQGNSVWKEVKNG